MLSESIKFLQQFAPDGLWTLTCIQPDRQGIETRTFENSENSRLLLNEWLTHWNGTRNIYFQVNQPKQPLSKKASRQDIKELNWLHVDVDPPKTINQEQLQIEQEKILKKFTSSLPDGIPRPSCLIFSGGGYQAFWKLDPAPVIDGNLDVAEELKLYNKQLESVFKADDCHNIDRIMRLPNTWNIPSEQKIKAGRVKVQSKLIWLEETSYELNQFVKYHEIQSTKGPSYQEATELKIEGEIQRIQDIKELDQWGVSDRVKVIILQGTHPEQEEINKKIKNGDTSRSAWLFDVCCHLSKCKVPPEVIYSLITDPNYAISDSVLDKGPSADRYARRQIERSIQNTVDPDLQRFNDQYAVIKQFGNKCRIHTEYYDVTTDTLQNIFMDVTNFKQANLNQTKMIPLDGGKSKTVKLADWWLEHPQRREYDRVVFYPAKTIPKTLNLWKGFSCEASPEGSCDLFLKHLKDNVCKGNDEYYYYLFHWLATMVQYPARPGEVAVVLRGGQGVGKGMIGRIIGSLFGVHYKYVSDPKHLVGSFNAHLRDGLFLFADEAFFAGDKKHESNLKALITETLRTIEAKGVDAEQHPNFLHIMMASNSAWVIPAGADDRRFFVLDVGEEQKQNRAYFQPLLEQMKNGGREKLLHTLMTADLSGFDLGKVPKTDALKEQKTYSYTIEQSWWLEKLEAGSLFDDGLWTTRVEKQRLYVDYLDTCESLRAYRPLSLISFSRTLNKLCGGKVEGHAYIRSEQHARVRAFIIPTLEECRQVWDTIYAPYEWPSVDSFQIDPLMDYKEEEHDRF
jgi:hypothetical protein